MKTISTFVIAFLIIGFFFLALPEKGLSGTPDIPVSLACCQLLTENTCFDVDGVGPAIACSKLQAEMEAEFRTDEICIEGAFCSGLEKSVPTLSEWGLVAMAAILGIVGYMVIRRRKVTA